MAAPTCASSLVPDSTAPRCRSAAARASVTAANLGPLAFLQFGAGPDDGTPLRGVRDPVDEQFAGLHQGGQQGLEGREGVIGVPDGVGERDGELL
jgi:hypothetical protein